MPDNATTWKLIHTERDALADTLEGLTPEQWATPSLCAGWSVQLAAGHVLAGAEQTALGFSRRHAQRAGSGFNTMVDRDARRLGALAPNGDRGEAARQDDDHESPTRARGGDARRGRRPRRGHPSTTGRERQGRTRRHGGVPGDVQELRTSRSARRSASPALRLVASDAEWSHGAGPEMTGPALDLLMVMTGRAVGGRADRRRCGDPRSRL